MLKLENCNIQCKLNNEYCFRQKSGKQLPGPYNRPRFGVGVMFFSEQSAAIIIARAL